MAKITTMMTIWCVNNTVFCWYFSFRCHVVQVPWMSSKRCCSARDVMLRFILLMLCFVRCDALGILMHGWDETSRPCFGPITKQHPDDDKVCSSLKELCVLDAKNLKVWEDTTTTTTTATPTATAQQQQQQKQKQKTKSKNKKQKTKKKKTHTQTQTQAKTTKTNDCGYAVLKLYWWIVAFPTTESHSMEDAAEALFRSLDCILSSACGTTWLKEAAETRSGSEKCLEEKK